MKQPRMEDAAHLAALRRLPCVCCGETRGIEAAHIRLTSTEWAQRVGIRTGAGGGEKPADCWALPMCADHHRIGPEAEHKIGTKEFWRRRQRDPHAIAWALYEASPDRERMTSIVFQALYMGLGRAA